MFKCVCVSFTRGVCSSQPVRFGFSMPWKIQETFKNFFYKVNVINQVENSCTILCLARGPELINDIFGRTIKTRNLFLLVASCSCFYCTTDGKAAATA